VCTNEYVSAGTRKNSDKELAMGDYTCKRIDDMEAIFHGSFRRAGAELGVESFGLQIFDLPAGADNYPEHDHSHDGQEEVYVVLRGSGEFEVDGERVPVDTERVIRVPAGTKRKLILGSDGIRVLALGGIPGEVYDRPEPFRLGAADPTAAA
jgi:mannose-6-phosphate isomerase-like protein (cupin superfamily)